MKEKHDSMTALSWGWPGAEKDWTTLFMRNSLRKVLEVYCAPWSLIIIMAAKFYVDIVDKLWYNIKDLGNLCESAYYVHG